MSNTFSRKYLPLLLACLVLAAPAHAVPALLPLLPLLWVLLAKGAALLGSLVFLMLSLIKKNRRAFLITTALVLFLLFVLLMVYYRHG